MFCSKCGNHLPDDAKFCSACGAPVIAAQKDSPVPQGPAGVTDETGKVPAPKPEPFKQTQNCSAPTSGGAAVSGKKSKKGLVIGLSIGGVLLAVSLAVVLIFVLGLKGGSFVPIGGEVVCDDEYTFYLSEDGSGSTARIMRAANGQDAEPEVLYEVDQLRGDGWGMYPLGLLFLWDDKVCFFELTAVSDGGAEEINLSWISKDGEEHGTLVSADQLSGLIDDERFAQVRNIYYYEDALVFSNGQALIWLDLNTGELREQNNVLQAGQPIHFVAYAQGYSYYVAFDANIEVTGGTLYRQKEGAEAEELCVLPQLDFTSESDHATLSTCVPYGEYLYFADETTIFRIHMEKGDVETLASYEGIGHRFAVTEAGLYYLKNMSLCLIDLETLAQTVFDLPEDAQDSPRIIYAGSDGGCWLKWWEDSYQYTHFIPDEDGGSFTSFGVPENETEPSAPPASADSPDTFDITPLYAAVVEQLIAEYGPLSFGGEDSYECYVTGVYKIHLLDMNQDGTDELVVLHTVDGEDIFPFVEVWTVQNGEAMQLFSEKPRNMSQEAEIALSLYENAGFYYIPVYDSLDNDPMYVHLYGFDQNGAFGEIYQYENNAFYMDQLPDGMHFTACEQTLFYISNRMDSDAAFENAKAEMMESLQTDMESMLNMLGLSAPEAAEQNETLEAGFYGVWVCASEEYAEAEQYADALVQKGFAAGIYETTDWSNLNTDPYYVASAGEFATENEANDALARVRDAGYADAYFKYTGEKRTG